MTEKRFTKYVPHSYGYTYITTIIDNEKNKQTGNTDEIVDMLNELNEENEQLKQSYTKLEHRHSLLHDECLDAECDRDSYHKDVLSLEKENEQLKSFVKRLTNNCGEIVLMNGMAYNVKKALGDLE